MLQRLLNACAEKLIDLVDSLADLSIRIIKVVLAALSVILTCYIIIMVLMIGFGEESPVTLIGTLITTLSGVLIFFFHLLEDKKA